MAYSRAICYVGAVLLAFVCMWQESAGHVALTYPPARKYDLDFLDNSRTKGPCGMPKGKFFLFIYSIILRFKT